MVKITTRNSSPLPLNGKRAKPYPVRAQTKHLYHRAAQGDFGRVQHGGAEAELLKHHTEIIEREMLRDPDNRHIVHIRPRAQRHAEHIQKRI